MRITRIAKLTLIAVWAFGVSGAAADVVTLSDGSRLLGTVERMSEGKLILATEFAGTLEIDATLVVQIATDAPVNVGMTSGDRLVGPIEWKPEVDRAVVQTEMGGIPVNVDRIEAIWPQDGKSPEVLAMEAQIEQVKAEAKAAEARWALILEVGLLFQDGNTDLFYAHGKGELRRTSPKDLLKFYLAGDYKEQNKERTSHRFGAGTYYEHMLSKRWFAYWRADVEYDEFENLDFRFSTTGGVGYYWLKEPDHELKTRGGVGYLHEDYADGVVNDAAQAELGLEYRVDIVPWMQFTHGTTYYPTFEALRDYRIVSDSALVFPLGESDVWKLKLGAQYEYKSIPNAGREALDQTYYTSIVAEFK